MDLCTLIAHMYEIMLQSSALQSHTNLSANLVVLVFYIYPRFQKSAMNANEKTTLLRIAKDLML